MNEEGMLRGIRMVMRITCSLKKESSEGKEFSQYFIRITPGTWKAFYRKNILCSMKGKILYRDGEYQMCSGEEYFVSYAGENYFCPKLNLSRQCNNCILYVRNNGHSHCGEKLQEFSTLQLQEIIKMSSLEYVRGGILVIDSTRPPVGHSQVFA